VRTGLGVDRAAVVTVGSLTLRDKLVLEIYRDVKDSRARALALDGLRLILSSLRLDLALLLLLANLATPLAPRGNLHRRRGKEGDLLLAQSELRLALGLAADHHAVVGAALLAVLGESLTRVRI